MKIIKVEFLEDICGLPKGTKKNLTEKLANEMKALGKVKFVNKRAGEKIEKLESKTPEKVETKKAPTKKVSRKKGGE